MFAFAGSKMKIFDFTRRISKCLDFDRTNSNVFRVKRFKGLSVSRVKGKPRLPPPPRASSQGFPGRSLESRRYINNPTSRILSALSATQMPFLVWRHRILYLFSAWSGGRFITDCVQMEGLHVHKTCVYALQPPCLVVARVISPQHHTYINFCSMQRLSLRQLEKSQIYYSFSVSLFGLLVEPNS